MDQPGGITFLLFVEPICLKDGAEEVTFKFLLTETVLLFLILVHRFYIDFFTFEFPLNKISISALPGKINSPSPRRMQDGKYISLAQLRLTTYNN